MHSCSFYSRGTFHFGTYSEFFSNIDSENSSHYKQVAVKYLFSGNVLDLDLQALLNIKNDSFLPENYIRKLVVILDRLTLDHSKNNIDNMKSSIIAVSKIAVDQNRYDGTFISDLAESLFSCAPSERVSMLAELEKNYLSVGLSQSLQNTST